MSQKLFSLLGVFGLMALVACNSTLELGIERTPTPNLAISATLTALQTQNDALATRVAALTTPTPGTRDLGKVAYVQGGDIWIKPLPDDKAQRLTTDGRNSDPRWSPSGNWIAFRKERTILVQRSVPCDVSDLRQESCRDLIPVLQKQLWAIEAHGNRTRLLNRGLTVNAFAWSPQDDRLALVGENGELNLLDIETAAVTPLVTPQAEATNPGNVERIVWSLDGTRIAYEWNQTNSSSAGLWLVTLYPVQRKQVYVSNAARRGDAILGGWMPDNQSIFFWQSDTRTALLNDGVPLYTLRLDSTPSSPQRLSDALLVHADFIAPAPTRSNAGSRNLIALTAGSGQSTWLNKRIEILKPLTPPNLSAMTPQWSPNGAQIAFVAMPQRPELSADDEVLQGLLQRRIWIADALGEREPQRVTNNASYRDERPLWSADGKHILFARFDRQGRVSLWLVTLNTNFTRQIVDELTPAPDPFGFYGHIEWDALFDWWRGVE